MFLKIFNTNCKISYGVNNEEIKHGNVFLSSCVYFFQERSKNKTNIVTTRSLELQQMKGSKHFLNLNNSFVLTSFD